MTKKILFLLKALVSLTAIGIIIWKVDISTVASNLKQVDILAFVFVIFIALFQYFLMGLRWHHIQKSSFPQAALSDSLKFCWIGQFFGLILPGGQIANDLTRGWYMHRLGGNLSKIGRVLLIEKFYLLLGGLFLCIPFLYTYFPMWFSIIGLGGLCVAYGLVLRFFKIPKAFLVMTCSFAGILLACVNSYILVHTVAPDIPFLSILTVFPPALILGALPISLGGWGIREGAFVYLMGWVGMAEEPALAVSIATSFAALIAALPGLYAWLNLSDRRRPEALCAE